MQREQNELLAFRSIKKLFLEVKDEGPETIHDILNKIRVHFVENVDKNRPAPCLLQEQKHLLLLKYFKEKKYYDSKLKQ
jgi:hypothetical protein